MCFGKGGAKMNRRGFLASALGFLAAPPIVRATSIMPVSVVPEIWTLPTGPAGYVLRYDYLTSNYAWFLPPGPGRLEQFSNDSPISGVGVENHFRKRRWGGKPISLA